MKIVFVGPTLPDARVLAAKDIIIRPPAIQGDLLRAVRSGASAVGIIDGNFEYVAPIWHKEILHALSHGVKVYGAASMGALRAAECADFGMIGVGRIFSDYAAGILEDDADVALLHGPAELGYLPLTVPLVNALATLEHLQATEAITADVGAALERAASAIFYKERTWSEIVRRAGLASPIDRQWLATVLKSGAVDQKRMDALELFGLMAAADDRRGERPAGWAFRATSMWKAVASSADEAG
ncbi:TfuA-like protein [Rhizobium giardinii]|uniref:TfuA-like core domain-containing protein n=1 Tax=Rhizobium giardinii TaxID=56731 RepID=A0A7W8U8W0_9HYPH|nr:TfuA-like protein [Rhizobium giardinii]MBB5534877.1 hypothetical protein [Rhizobium giardinii]